MKHKFEHILIMAAVEAERDAILRGLAGDMRVDVMLAGVGLAIAAVNTTKALSSTKYDLVLSAGIGGGFSGKAALGHLVIATTIIAADLGVETSSGFQSLDELGFGFTSVQVDAELVQKLAFALSEAKIPVCIGPVLTVSTVTGTAESTAEMLKRVPDAAAEGMEGYGVALAAQSFGVPVLELRTISNLVGPRDREAWRVPEALKVLEEASAVLTKFLLKA